MDHEASGNRGRRPAAEYALSITLVALANWAEMLVAAHGGPPFVFMANGLAIAATAWLAGFVPAVLAIIVSAAAADYFVLVPGRWLDWGGPVESAAFAAFVAGWAAVAWMVRGARVRSLREIDARIESNRMAAQAARLADLSAALGRARSAAAVIEAAIQEGLHSLTADAGMLLLVGEDPRTATVARAIAYDSRADLTTRSISLQGRGPIAEAVRRRAPLVLPSHQPYADDDLVPSAYTGMAAVPIAAGGRVVAIVRFDFLAPRVFTDDDQEYLDVLGRFTGHTLERARQYEAAQRARDEAEGLRARADQELAQRQQTEQALRSSETRYRALATRTTRLHALTAALSEAVTVDAVATALVQHGNVVVGAASARVSLLADDGLVLDVLYAEVHGQPIGEPARLTLAHGLCEHDALDTRAPVFVASWDAAQERYWRSAAAAADAAYVSTAVLPLLVEGAPIGALRFDFGVPVNFDADYRALLVSVAQHCTQALDRAHLYEAAQQARADAEAANRHKDEFLSTVSHELRTPLNAVLGWASILQKGTTDASLTTRAVHSIHENAARQAKLIDDLLDLSRIVAGRATLDVHDVDLATLLAGVADAISPLAAAGGIELTLPRLPHAIVQGDRRRLEQVFFNLLSNGLKFTTPGGRIEVDAAVSHGEVEVCVRDTGVGIDPDFLPLVFERFRQGDGTATRYYGGLGLGLSIAKQLVEAHGGTIGAASEGTGKGATFVVRLPVVGTLAAVPQSGYPAGPHAPAIAPPRLDGVRVLGVDDEPAARDIMACALQAQGAAVTVAANAAEAFDALTSQEFDVLLADIAMPQEDGCSLLRRVRSCANARIASIPAAAVTAHARDEERRAVLAAGFQLHLVKPIEPADLARAVDQLARGPSVG